MESINQPSPQERMLKSKMWFSHRGLIAIAVLAVIAAAGLGVYLYINYPSMPKGIPKDYAECVKAGGTLQPQLYSVYPPQCVYGNVSVELGVVSGKYHYYLGIPGVYLTGQYPPEKYKSK